MTAMDAREGMDQGHVTAGVWAAATGKVLCKLLDIERGSPKWRERLAPFAGVWAAMIAAAATDYATAVAAGVVDNTLQNDRRDGGRYDMSEAEMTKRLIEAGLGPRAEQ
jgi:hypothetical protein